MIDAERKWRTKVCSHFSLSKLTLKRYIFLPFPVVQVRKIMNDVLKERFDGFTYDGDTASSMCAEICQAVKRRVKGGT